ncbi:globin domain-containing protein [Streptomyces sp. NPDC048717]|uniref:globin domain-containing protein n=1 Tax=Streptomyces sp. NPDC048717 TaxID=3154928 RepID=UPI00341CB9E7
MTGHHDDYHALLARREAMKLRDNLLRPSRSTGGDNGHPPAPLQPYDGAADQEAITRSLAAVTPFGTLINRLYEAMFSQHPYLRQLFPDSMEFQQAHLEKAFWYMIDHLDRPDELTAAFAQLGRDHRRLGVLPVHYEVFEASLVTALRACAGHAWTAEAEQAWVRMTRTVSAAMVNGAQRAIGEPVSWNATVTEHERRGADLAVIRVRPAEPYPFRAGQYARVESPMLPHTWRPYTPACVPGEELEFHVRRTGPGGVSDALVTQTRVGDELRLGPAQGHATLDEQLDRDILIVAGGTGWASAKGLLQELSHRRPAGLSAHLFLGSRTEAELYDETALARLEERCPWLRVTRVIDDGRHGDLLMDTVLKAGAGAAGSGSASGSGSTSGTGGADWSRHTVFVSGPAGLVASAGWRFTEAGVPQDRIRHDPLPVTSTGGAQNTPSAHSVPSAHSAPQGLTTQGFAAPVRAHFAAGAAAQL